MKLTLVTGSQAKLSEWRRLLPADITFDHIDIDLPEIQSDDVEVVVADKAKRAYAIVGRPVMVEDISVGLQKLGGLPGPFIKFFVQTLGSDALRILAGQDAAAATVICAVAYYDGEKLIVVSGRVNGNVVTPAGENGFGFDKGFKPEGCTKTYGEMTHQEKDAVSHRSVAIKQFMAKLRDEL